MPEHSTVSVPTDASAGYFGRRERGIAAPGPLEIRIHFSGTEAAPEQQGVYK